MINLQWLDLPMYWTIFYGPKDVWATEDRLFVFVLYYCSNITETRLFKYIENFTT